MRGFTSQSVGLTDPQRHGEQREGVDEVHAEMKDALEQHHHQPQLPNTQRHGGVENKQTPADSVRPEKKPALVPLTRVKTR